MIGRRSGISLAAAAFVLLVVGSYAVAGPRDGPPKVPDSKKFEARLNGFQEVPSVSTEAFGRFEAELVNDTTLRAEYISMAPGAKTPRRLHPDTRAWWIVQDGQIRFTIDGQEPFVARKGFLVQVPYRNVYSMETVGDTPSLRLEVNIGGATTMYPADEKPSSLPGFNFVKVRIGGKGAYDARNKPYVDFNAVAAGTDPTRRFIADDRAVANIIRGKPQQPGPNDKGHFHLESSEFWFILEGQIRYRIGSLPVFLADQGDIVYVPKQTWHLASHGPTPMSTRLAMNGYQDLLHNWEPTEDQTRR